MQNYLNSVVEICSLITAAPPASSYFLGDGAAVHRIEMCQCSQFYQLKIKERLVGGAPLASRCLWNGGERRTVFRLQVYERVEISQVEVYEKVGKTVIAVCKRPKKPE